MAHDVTSVAPVATAADRFEHNVAFTGIGRSQMTPVNARSWTAIAVEACRTAVADAGLVSGDIDGLCVSGGSTGLPGLSSDGVRGLEYALGLHPRWHTGARELPGPAGTLVAAMLAVATGLCRHVLCLTAVAGERAESDLGAGPAFSRRWVALAAAEYLETFGHSREAFGWVAVAARRHASAHPESRYGSPLEMHQYLLAETVCEPLGVCDFALPGDGAVAFVISSSDVAKGPGSAPVWVDAVGTRRGVDGGVEGSLAGYLLHAATPAEHLWSRASIGREAIDFLAIDDSSTLSVLCWIEALGLCGPGDGANFVAGGVRIGPGGTMPVNPHGGELITGARGGYTNLYEAIRQLRGVAGSQQVSGARAAIFSSSGSTGSATAMILVADHAVRDLRRSVPSGGRGPVLPLT